MAEKKIRQVEILGGVSEAAVEDGIQIHNLEWRGDSWSHRVVLLLRLLLSWLLKAEYIGDGKTLGILLNIMCNYLLSTHLQKKYEINSLFRNIKFIIVIFVCFCFEFYLIS